MLFLLVKTILCNINKKSWGPIYCVKVCFQTKCGRKNDSVRCSSIAGALQQPHIGATRFTPCYLAGLIESYNIITYLQRSVGSCSARYRRPLRDVIIPMPVCSVPCTCTAHTGLPPRLPPSRGPHRSPGPRTLPHRGFSGLWSNAVAALPSIRAPQCHRKSSYDSPRRTNFSYLQARRYYNTAPPRLAQYNFSARILDSLWLLFWISTNS